MTVSAALGRPLVTVPLFLAGVYACGVTSVLFAPAGSEVALWWPAAGLSVVLLLLHPRRWWWALALGIVLVSGLANLTAGRPPVTSLGYGLSNAVEAAVTAVWITRGRTGRPALRTQQDLLRLLAGTLLGVACTGVGIGVTVSATLGGGFLLAARTVLASHAAAILVIVPLALAIDPPEVPWSRREAAVQWLALVLCTGYVFGPGQVLGLAFLPMPLLAWAALRASPRVVSWQLVVLAALTTALSAHGWGPFAVGNGSGVTAHQTTGWLAQAFLITCALIALPLAVAVEQRKAALARVSESEELFRRSFTDSIVGMLLLRRTDGRLCVVEANGTAAEIFDSTEDDLVGRDWCALLATPTALEEIVGSLLSGERSGWREEVSLAADGRRRVAVSLSPLSMDEGDPMFTAHMVDVTAAHEAHLRLRTEKDFTSAIIDTTGCVIVLVDVETGVVVGMNPAAQTVTGFREQEVRDRPLWETLVPPSERAEVRLQYSAPGGAGIPLASEADLATRSGGRRRVAWSNAFLTDDAGVRTHVVMTGIDVTTERTTAGLVSHLMRAATTTALVGTDLDGRITVFNSGAQQMLGYAARDMIGRFLPRDIFDADEVARRAAAAGVEPNLGLLTAGVDKGSTPETHDWTIVRSDRSRFTASVTVSPVTDTFGQHIGYLGVGNDVTEQRRTQDLLIAALEKEREAVDRLRQLDQAKSDFVSTVSHELRTPITSIVGYTEMLQDGAAGDLSSGQHRLVDAVRRNGDRLIALADDLLTLSSFEAGTYSLEHAEVDLREVVARAREALQPLTAGRRLDVAFDQPDRPVPVRGDAGHLERVVFNLMSNAVKFTEDGGRVACVLRAAGDDAHLEVSDSGIGIPAAEPDGLFTRFFRSSTAQERAIQGTGLGLSIVASIVREHGGDIDVRSEHLRGTTFTVRLPLAGHPAYAGAHAAR
ncbi:MAG: PAS domain S-box protein [Nocardioidaceae bacterium]